MLNGTNQTRGRSKTLTILPSDIVNLEVNRVVFVGPPGAGNQVVWVRAALAVGKDSSVLRMTYQVEILIEPPG